MVLNQQLSDLLEDLSLEFWRYIAHVDTIFFIKGSKLLKSAEYKQMNRYVGYATYVN